MGRSQLSRLEDSAVCAASVKGAVHRSRLQDVYKHAQAYISFSDTSISRTESAWRQSKQPLAAYLWCILVPLGKTILEANFSGPGATMMRSWVISAI